MASSEKPPVNPSSTQGRVASFLSQITYTLATKAMREIDSRDHGDECEKEFGKKSSLEEMINRVPKITIQKK